MEQRPLPTALYCRLSREDGDRMESDSIGNQRKLLEAYIENHPELTVAECYADATVIIGLKQNPTNGRRFSPIFLLYRAFCGAKRRMPL